MAMQVYSYLLIFRFALLQFSDQITSADAVGLTSVPTVQSVDYHLVENTAEHHTKDYHIVKRDENPKLVVRRGQKFKLTISFKNKPYDKEKNDLRLVFEIGESPNEVEETRTQMNLSDKDVAKEWRAEFVKQEQNWEDLTLTISTPSHCKVGEWNFKVDVIEKDTNATNRYIAVDSIYILFNPWNQDDQVFYPDEKLLSEYVYKDTGIIYRNISGVLEGKDWNYGQFEENIVDCVLSLLKTGMKMEARGDPVKVVRKLAKLTNVQDEDGILIGKWSGDFSDGKHPSIWNGSRPILQQYCQNKEPVKYAGSWVFAGVLTTLCRTLGIPTRTVTIFGSADDMDGSTTIDKKYSSDGNLTESDSVWNYHCWNGVWMSRPELPKGFGGWQAIDATPRKISDGSFRCGPSPLPAIKNGQISLPYDTGFMFAGVNGDVIKWVENEQGKFVKSEVDTKSVGKKIVTKKPFMNRPEDITDQYKYPEDSPEEKAAKIQANQKSSIPGIFTTGEKVLEFELRKTVYYGEKFDVHLNISNTGDEARTVGGIINIYSIHTTGVLGYKIKSHQINDVVVQKKSEKVITVSVSLEEYAGKLVKFLNVKASYLCRTKEVNQHYTGSDWFSLQQPTLTCKVPPEVRVFENFSVEVSFTNPLDKPLTNCYLYIQSPHLHIPTRKGASDVQAEQKHAMSVNLNAENNPGYKTIIVQFESKELLCVIGSCEIKVIG